MNIRGERVQKEREKLLRKSGSLNTTTGTSQDEGGCSSKKKKGNLHHQAIWGNPRTAIGRKRFREYLINIKSAEPFLRNARSFIFLKNMGRKTRRQVYKRLREVDLAGYNKVLGRMRNVKYQANKAKLVAMELVVKEDAVAVEQEIDCTSSPRLLKLLPLGGLKNMLALCVAAGHTRDEVAGMAQMEPAEFNALVTAADVRAAAKEMPNAITHLANGIVLRDLLKGEVSTTTKEADMIVARRSKVAVEVSKETRERTKFSDELEKKREDAVATRFGIDRKTGEVVDADNKS